MCSLEEFNQSIVRLGYAEVTQRDFEVILAASSGRAPLWIESLNNTDRSDPSTANELLRSALFGVSATCFSMLHSIGIDAPPVRLCTWLIDQGSYARKVLRALSDSATSQSLRARALKEIRLGLGLEHLSSTEQNGSNIKDRTMKVRGSKYALTLERTWDSKGCASLQVEMARAVSFGVYDWSSKLAIQLKEHEVVELLGVLIGPSRRAEFGNHGDQRDKHCSIEAQSGASGNGFYINLRRAKDSRGVLIPSSQAFRAIALSVQVIQEHNPHLSPEDVLSLVKTAASRFPINAAV